LKQPTINQYLSGSTATLTTDSVTVLSTGTLGEFTDLAPTHCDDVTVSITSGVFSVENTDGGSDNSNEVYYLKSCLSTSDYDADTNQDVNNWDTGSSTWPHLVKFIETDSTDGGYYSLVVYELGSWNLMHDIPLSDGTELDVFTTDSTMQLVFLDKDGDTHYNNLTETINVTVAANPYGETTVQLAYDASCDTNNTFVSHCLQKGDMIMFTNSDWSFSENDVATGEFYTITRVWTVLADTMTGEDTYFISVDHTVNFDYSDGYVYVLTEEDETYDYVTECSNRGYCNRDEGLCECFHGYTNDNCDTQSALSK
jgi:hypothetical protein